MLERYRQQGRHKRSLAQGRALIPQVLRNYAKLERDAVVIGVGNRAEIWQPELWQQECGNMVPEDIMDHVADLGF